MAATAETDLATTPVIWRRWFAGDRGRWLGILLSVALAAVIVGTELDLLARARNAAFDYYQLLMPRERKSQPPIVVGVDEKSLAAVGQWPWPRVVIAELIDRIAARKPSAIAVDVLFIEPDRSAPERVPAELRPRERTAARAGARVRSNDEVLAEAIANAPVILGISAADATTDKGALMRERGPLGIDSFPGAQRSLSELDTAAQGHGIINVEPELGIVRRVPLAAYIGGELTLSLPVAAYGVAQEKRVIAVSEERGVSLLHVAEKRIPMQSDGKAWLHFAKPMRVADDAPQRPGARPDPQAADLSNDKVPTVVSAIDVLRGLDATQYQNRPVLLGVTVPMLDTHTTARGDRVSGVEIHAQILESVADDAFLSRPLWMRYAEAFVFLLGAGLLVGYVPMVPPRRSFAILVACWLVLLATGVGSFYWVRSLFDPVTPIAAVTMVYGFMLSATLVRLEDQRRQLSLRLATEREAAARVTGELEAARRIQTGMLPTRESVLQYERRVELFAHMSAAREVGGDLYDFFPLPGDRFVVFVGDVSGKGLPAAMFMAVSKALAKSAAMRGNNAGPAEIMTILNAEISRENPEQNFVTMVALVIDLKTGQLDYCNAGHETPVLSRRSGEIIALDQGGGPPVCVMEGYAYEQASIRLEPRDVLVLASDGLTEAMNPQRQLYGRQRLLALLDSPLRQNVDPTVLGNEILTAIRRFEAGSEPADDQTLLLVSWRGAL